ncbi:MAG TPA: hypothetical protein PKB01_01755 [Xanthobacteraceae bacterium]|nr:hypothetical protein [Xanthobacteraceae bacterium]
MQAATTKIRAAQTNVAAAPVTMNDVLVTAIFFGTIACATLLFIKLAA